MWNMMGEKLEEGNTLWPSYLAGEREEAQN